MFDNTAERALYSRLQESLESYLADLRPAEQDSIGEDESEPLAEMQERVSIVHESLTHLGDGMAPPELRWQLQHSYTTLLLVQARGGKAQATCFRETLDNLRQTIVATRKSFIAEAVELELYR